MFRKSCKYFAIEHYILFLERCDQFAVACAVDLRSSRDLDAPEVASITLFEFAVVICALTGFADCGASVAYQVFAALVVALSLLEEGVALACAGGSTFYSCHTDLSDCAVNVSCNSV